MARAYGGYTTQRDLSSVKKRMSKAPVHSAIAVMDKNDRILSLIWDNTDKRAGRKQIMNTVRLITMYASGTSMSAACELTGLKYKTVERWLTKPWFLECVNIARARIDNELDNKFTGIVEKGASNLAEQLEHGESVLQRDGSLIRKPVSAKDTAIITSIIFDKRNLLRGKPTSVTHTQSTTEKLSELQERFQQFANGKEIEGEAEIVEEGEIIE
jgi:hypothetical protein